MSEATGTIPVTHAEWTRLIARLPPTAPEQLEEVWKDSAGVHLATERAALSILNPGSSAPGRLKRPQMLAVSPDHPLHVGAVPFPRGVAVGVSSPLVSAVSLMVLALRFPEYPCALGAWPGLGWSAVPGPWPLWHRAPMKPGTWRVGEAVARTLMEEPLAAWAESDVELSVFVRLERAQTVCGLQLEAGRHYFVCALDGAERNERCN